MNARESKSRLIRIAVLVLVPAVVFGCKDTERPAAEGLGDSALFATDADLPLADRPVVRATSNYQLDDDMYRRWAAAQRELDRVEPDVTPIRISSRDPSSADIDRAVAFLESNPDTRRALATSGLSARHYVLTTLALAEASAAAANLSGGSQNERFIARHRDDFERVRGRSRFRVVDSDRDTDSDSDGKRGKGRKRGHRDTDTDR